jgi:hypothetical protein
MGVQDSSFREALMANDQTPMIKLDRSRLLGFDQAPRAGDDDGAAGSADQRLTRLGAKVGNKFGAKVGLRLAV